MCLLCEYLLIDARIEFLELLAEEGRNGRREAGTAVSSSNTHLLSIVMGPNQVLRCNNSASESSSILDTGTQVFTNILA
jgi:hypothetical protein